jgi:CIC family chloride channel protein
MHWRSTTSQTSATLLGAVLGAVIGGFVVIGVTLVLKAGMDFVAGQGLAYILLAPVVGLAAAALVLHVLGKGAGNDRNLPHQWRAFHPEAIRADISSDIVDSAGEEEKFPWRLAPIRALAVLATVGSGNAMGTEAPAAYLGVAAGAFLGDRGRRWRRLLRPAAVAGGAAGVSALMGIPLVGSAFILELGRRQRAPLTAQRLLAALVGGAIGWGISAGFHLTLIRLVVPHEPPLRFTQAVVAAVLVGGLAGIMSSLAGLAFYRAKKWRARPIVRVALGGAAVLLTALLIARVAAPSAATGPGGGAIAWAENAGALPATLLLVCALRVVATSAAVAAGGCGGVFVPLLAIGDIAGRVFAPGLGVGSDLAGAAGAAGGIAGGYRLPATAALMVLGVGGPRLATLTCLATVGIAYYAALGVEAALEWMRRALVSRRQVPVH